MAGIRWPRWLQPFASRPDLVAGAVAGGLVYLATGPWVPRAVTRGLLGWDFGVFVFIVLALLSMRDTDDERMKARALAHDEGRHFMLALSLAAASASVVAILAELGQAKGADRLHTAFGVGLTAATIALSWFFLHLVFAIHYAHVFYMAKEAEGAVHKGGLMFPDDETPDYWDFLHFGVVIGATAQTADISITSKEIRRVATVHCLIAFAFNTAILATMINLAAGLF